MNVRPFLYGGNYRICHSPSFFVFRFHCPLTSCEAALKQPEGHLNSEVLKPLPTSLAFRIPKFSLLIFLLYEASPEGCSLYGYKQ